MNAEEVRDYYTKDVGELPPQVEIALRSVPEAFAGYMQMRRFVLDDENSDDALPKAYVNLIFTTLDVTTGNLMGGLNHARAALEAGLPWKSLMQAMVQVWIVRGFASTWGIVGYQLIDLLEKEGYGPGGRSAG